MLLRRLTTTIVFAVAMMANASVFAAPLSSAPSACLAEALDAVFESPVLNELAAPTFAESAPAIVADAAAEVTETTRNPRQLLAAFAMELRDIRYRRGGRAPSTGFDCSGFVHYVFAHALGIDLPSNSAEQFHAGTRIARDELQTGDLVFFHTHGKRISHVGIYLGDGRFIHSPTTGQRVRVDRLNEHYWARHFAGAKRPDGVAKADLAYNLPPAS